MAISESPQAGCGGRKLPKMRENFRGNQHEKLKSQKLWLEDVDYHEEGKLPISSENRSSFFFLTSYELIKAKNFFKSMW